MMHDEHKRIKTLDRNLYKLQEGLTLSLLNPLNIDQEKKRFFRIKGYNPVFRYKEHGIDLDKRLQKLNKLIFGDTSFDMLLKMKAEELKNVIMMHKNIGKEDFTKYSIKVYGHPSKSLIKKAKELRYKGRIVTPQKTITTKEAIRYFIAVFESMDIDWHIAEEDLVANAMVIPRDKKLLIKKDTHFSKHQVRRYIAHEIYGHVLRTEMGLMQPYKIFSTGFADYEATEEGLALYKESLMGTLDQKALKGYAGRVLAIEKAIRKSFRETYELLTRYYSSEQAWSMTVRVKRGMIDTSQPGAFTKDLIYLKGYLQIKDYLAHNPMKLLHYGKIRIKDIPIIRKMEGLKDPNRFMKKERKLIKKLVW